MIASGSVTSNSSSSRIESSFGGKVNKDCAFIECLLGCVLLMGKFGYFPAYKGNIREVKSDSVLYIASKKGYVME